MSGFKARYVGSPNTFEHRIFFERNGVVVSPWHDIPLLASSPTASPQIFNMIVEIPRWSNAKQEISKDEPYNPIKQDIKKGKLRFVRNCFPHHGYPFTYGAIPQARPLPTRRVWTWEDPTVTHPETKAKGDNDPIDVCEIGEEVGYPGQIKQVKILGTMALLDEGETDWKLIAIDVNDPLASKLNDIEDVERHLPGLLRATNEFWRIYKIPDGKQENSFAFSGECKNKKYALEVIKECNEAWERLITAKVKAPEGVNTMNLTVANSPYRVDPRDAPPVPPGDNLPPAPIDPSIDKWFFISVAPS